MILLMNPSAAQVARSTGQGRPLWFAAPLVAADRSACFQAGFTGWRASSLLDLRSRGALVFTVGWLEGFVSLLPEGMAPVCALFQWKPLEHLTLLKKWLYRRVLGRSRVLVTYSRDSEVYLRTLFPNKPIVWLGHFVDTDFFQPTEEKSGSERYFLCVGNHKRYEDVIIRLAAATGTVVIRVSSDPKVAQYHSLHSSPLVKVLQDVQFAQLRQLYQDAEIMLNVVDDKLWPVGITSFCEALAMDTVIITSSGHSCSGYVFDDGTKPYFTVESPEDVECWLAAVHRVYSEGRIWEDGRRPRDMALKFCSFESARATWGYVNTLLCPGKSNPELE